MLVLDEALCLFASSYYQDPSAVALHCIALQRLALGFAAVVLVGCVRACALDRRNMHAKQCHICGVHLQMNDMPNTLC